LKRVKKGDSRQVEGRVEHLMPQGGQVFLLWEILSELNGSFVMGVLSIAVLEVGSLYLNPMSSDHD